MKLFTITFIFTTALVISSFDNPLPSPDPESFGKKVVELIKTGDTALYIATFKLDQNVLNEMVETVNEDPYMTQRGKARLRNELYDGKELLVKTTEDLSRNIQIIEGWKKNEGIDLKKVEYLRTYFEFEYEPEDGFPVLDDAFVLIKHKASVYLFKFDEVVFHKNKWYLGRLESIVKPTPDFEGYEASYSYSNLSGQTPEYKMDETVAVDSVAIDVAVADTVVATVSPYNPTPEPSFINKKRLKKIRRLEEKLEKLYRGK